MSTLRTGYWPETYWPGAYWPGVYWPKSAIVKTATKSGVESKKAKGVDLNLLRDDEEVAEIVQIIVMSGILDG